MRYLGLLFVLIACSQTPSQSQNTTPPISEKPVYQYPIQNIEIYNGKIKYVRFKTPLSNGAQTITCKWGENQNETFKGQVKDGFFEFYLAESYFSEPHQKQCLFDSQVVLKVNVKEFAYKREKLNVPKRKVDLSPQDLERVKAEEIIKKEIYKESANHFLFDQPFEVPLKSKITSYYGNQRLFNDKKKAQHLGVDLRAWVGVKIPANNRGVVVYTGDLFFSGQIVVIDHGLDVFTVYMHLSKIFVKKGDVVTKGDIVGLAGKTGRVSGPHLHWGVRINGHWVDGFTLVDQSKRQFLPIRNN